MQDGRMTWQKGGRRQHSRSGGVAVPRVDEVLAREPAGARGKKLDFRFPRQRRGARALREPRTKSSVLWPPLRALRRPAGRQAAGPRRQLEDGSTGSISPPPTGWRGCEALGGAPMRSLGSSSWYGRRPPHNGLSGRSALVGFAMHSLGTVRRRRATSPDETHASTTASRRRGVRLCGHVPLSLRGRQCSGRSAGGWALRVAPGVRTSRNHAERQRALSVVGLWGAWSNMPRPPATRCSGAGTVQPQSRGWMARDYLRLGNPCPARGPIDAESTAKGDPRRTRSSGGWRPPPRGDR